MEKELKSFPIADIVIRAFNSVFTKRIEIIAHWIMHPGVLIAIEVFPWVNRFVFKIWSVPI